MTQSKPNVTIKSWVDYKGQPMFSIEKLTDGKVLLNEYTDNGIIKHEFDSHLAMEMWVFKYRSLQFE